MTDALKLGMTSPRKAPADRKIARMSEFIRTCSLNYPMRWARDLVVKDRSSNEGRPVWSNLAQSTHGYEDTLRLLELRAPAPKWLGRCPGCEE